MCSIVSHLSIMTQSTHVSYGMVSKIEVTDKGYTKIVLTVNIPFKQKIISFNIWNKKLLQDKSEKIGVGDNVEVMYHYKDKFTVLDKIVRVDGFDNCPICFCNLELSDAQRIECPGCSLIDESEYKDRITENMKLVACSLNEYQYSSGYRVEFINEQTNKKIVTVIFRNNPLFEKVDNLLITETYLVIGWQTKDNFQTTPFEITDILVKND